MVKTITESGLLKDKVTDRYLSLDVLRGLTVALMIVVNTPGSWSTNYGPLLHAPWHGFTITDLVFPSFLFVVGNAMSFSMKKMAYQDRAVFLKKVFRRTVLIFVIGLLLTAYPFFRIIEGDIVLFDFSKIRIMGVLQRIALCYALASILLYFFKKRGAVLFSVFSLLGYWWFMYYFGERGDPYSLIGNAALKLDLWLIGEDNMYKGEGIPFEPEGLISTLPATINVIVGYFVGDFIQRSGNNVKTVITLIGGGILAICLAYFWDILFPINKKIWTSSYVLLTVGFSTITIAFLMYLMEVMTVKRWSYFFEVFGKNPLILYVLSGLVIKSLLVIRISGNSSKDWIYQNLFMDFFTPKNSSLLFALAYMLLIWGVGYFMDKKRIYIKV